MVLQAAVPDCAIPGWPFEPGSIGPYSLVATLGRGGMGVVYLAVRSKSELVAVKTLNPELRTDAHAIARFEREIDLATRFEHPNVVRAVDSGHYRGVPFLVMEYLDGMDLSRLLDCCGPVSIADACEIARQMALGLEGIHRRDVIHRDIKPGNALVTRQGTVKVLDMGLAFLAGEKANPGGLAVSDQCVGSLNYMAPEQFEDSWSVTPAVDLYGLGATLFQLLCGVPPFHGALSNRPLKTYLAAATREAPPLTLRRPDACEPLAALVARLLSKDPRKRHASAATLADALHLFADDSDLTNLINAADAQARSRRLLDGHASSTSNDRLSMTIDYAV